MENERSAVIVIGGKEYELLLTTKATKEIAKKYGGLSKLGEELGKSENFEKAIDEIVWLIALLANQTILVHNFQHPNEQKELLSEETIELLTTPSDSVSYKEAISACLVKGTKREVVSEEKNAVVG